MIINKSTDSGKLDWIKEYLRPIWTAIFALYSLYLFSSFSGMEVVMDWHRNTNQHPILVYIIIGFVGAFTLCCYWWFAGKMFTTTDSKQKIKTPPSLHELYKSDFPTTMRPSYDFDVSFKDGTKVRVSAIEYLDFQGKSKFMGFYIPQSVNTYDVCVAIADNYKSNMNHLESSGTIRAWISGESTQTSSHDLIFSGRIYIYHDDFMTLQQLATLESLYQSKGLSVVFRSDAYMQSQWNK
jgi:hypothetical protein